MYKPRRIAQLCQHEKYALRGDNSLNCECCTLQISFQDKQQVARLNVSLYVVNQVQQEIKRLNCKCLWDRNNI